MRHSHDKLGAPVLQASSPVDVNELTGEGRLNCVIE